MQGKEENGYHLERNAAYFRLHHPLFHFLINSIILIFSFNLKHQLFRQAYITARYYFYIIERIMPLFATFCVKYNKTLPLKISIFYRETPKRRKVAVSLFF